MSSEQSSEDRFMEWLEAWLSGYNAARDGVGTSTFIQMARDAFERSGGELARKVASGELSREEAEAIMADKPRYGERG